MRFADLIAGARQQAERAIKDPARLAAARAALSGLDAGLAPLNRDLPPLPSELLDRYAITGELHRGGQGIVFAAIQKSTGRRVAIKVMLQGPYARREEMLRFEREVQILGQLDHPNIVGILDSGVSRGLFYFVMEYVDGESLGNWMGRRLDAAPPPGRGSAKPSNTFDRPSTVTKQQVDDVLKLFLKICAAVHAAHLRGVIHRDLKPGNIQIDSAGEPRVLDFGLAKVDPLSAGGSSREAGFLTMPAPQTQAGQFFGSLPWASPEQAAGRLTTVDVRSDVYSLGVILFQLLTNCFPYRVEGSTAETLQTIQHAEPTRLRVLNPAIDDELETISLKCLQKDPDRRYQSAGELAEDIRRYAAGEPIAAKRDAMTYLIRKQLGRYRATIVVGGAFLLLLVGGATTSFVLWRRAATDRDKAISAQRDADLRRAEAVRAQRDADAKRAEAETVTTLLESLLASADPLAEKGPDYRVVQLLDDFDATLGDRLRDQPQVAARVHSLMGRAYRELAQYEKSNQHLERARDLHRRVSGEQSDAAIASTIDLAHLRLNEGRFAEAERLYQMALDAAVALHGEKDGMAIDALSGLGETMTRSGDFERAQPMVRRAVQMARDAGDRQRLGSALHCLGMLLDDLYDRGSIDAYKEAVEVDRSVYGARHQNTAVNIIDLAQAQSLFGDLDSAEANLREGIGILTETFGPDHVKVAGAGEILGVLLSKRGKLEEAEALTRKSLEVHERVLGRNSPQMVSSLNNLGVLMNDLNRPAEAKKLLSRSLALYRKTKSISPHEAARTLNNLAKSEFALKQFDEAEGHLREALKIDEGLFRPDHLAVLEDYRGLAHVLAAKGDYEAAVAAQRHVAEAIGGRSPEEEPRGAPAVIWLADLLAARAHGQLKKGDAAEAEKSLRECLEIRRRLLEDGDWRIGSTLGLLGAALDQLGSTDEARRCLEEGWRRMSQNAQTPAIRLAEAAERLAVFLERHGEGERAAEIRAATQPSSQPAP